MELKKKWLIVTKLFCLYHHGIEDSLKELGRAGYWFCLRMAQKEGRPVCCFGFFPRAEGLILGQITMVCLRHVTRNKRLKLYLRPLGSMCMD